MRQWKSLVALHASAPSSFPHPPSPSPPRGDDEEYQELEEEEELVELESDAAKSNSSLRPVGDGDADQAAVRLVGCDGRVRLYRPPVTARELMQAHPRHLVCRADALLIGEKIPALAAGAELQPGQAYFLLPAHLFRSVLSFVSLASSLLLLLSTAAGKGGAGGKQQRPKFELQRTASGTLQIKFSDDFLVGDDEEHVGKEEEESKKTAVLRGDERLEKEYEELVGYGKSRRWAPKLDPIEEVVVVAEREEASSSPSSTAAASSSERGRKSRGGIVPFLGRLGSRRRRDSPSSSSGCAAVACSS